MLGDKQSPLFCICDACRYARVMGLRTALDDEEHNDTRDVRDLGIALLWLAIGALVGLLIAWSVIGASDFFWAR